MFLFISCLLPTKNILRTDEQDDASTLYLLHLCSCIFLTICFLVDSIFQIEMNFAWDTQQFLQDTQMIGQWVYSKFN